MNKLTKTIKELLNDGDFTAVDVGARGDIPYHWLLLDGIAKFICFEADIDAYHHLQKVYNSRGNGHLYKIIPVALAKDSGVRTLFLTHSRSASSLFNPDTPMIRGYVNSNYLDPIKESEIEVKSAGGIFQEIDEQDLDLVKLDIQGAELEVLESMGQEILASIVAIEIEANMIDRGNGSPTFVDIHKFMASQGFELYDMRPMRVHRTLNGSRDAYLKEIFHVYTKSPSISARIWQCDMLYYRPPEPVIKRYDIRKLYNLIVSFCIYGFYTEALHTAKLMFGKSMISEIQHDAIMNNIFQWHKTQRYRLLYSLNPVCSLFRWLVRYYGWGKHPEWWPYN